tara:strand:- start:1684 stop:2754 length:1071 start_codon:yes stop_codon:yes gene_type:complete
MNKKINFSLKEKKYSVEIELNSIKNKIESITNTNSNVIFLIDKKVFNVFKKVKNYKNLKYITINCSEKIKSFQYYSILSNKMLSLGVNRKSVLVAIGGGTLGDLAGFIASTLLRGVDLILIPTTLLSQVDSSVGGKNGINTNFGKNLVGTFYQPKLVIIDPYVLSSLPKRELLSGYAEIVKHAIIYDQKFFNWLNRNSKDIFKLKYDVLSKAIYKSVSIKKTYVVKDEKEKLKNKYSRAILNFGHTFGHALETYYNYNKRLTHGEAISIGMMIATKISYKLNYLSLQDVIKIKNHFIANSLPIEDKEMYNKKIFQIIYKDKKNTDDKVNFILLKSIGKSFLKSNINLNKIKKLLNK